ncbi:N-acetyltransferase [Paenibacillus sp. GSMTC-2017]|uniref:GNAT family N-acetyltransferase n=1 Tax=Paenibacillus sp. GSMTC-2017 TaxID=2794350 RepID=UPI0018D825A9|nr:GNAT family N-acetyltransferase [Paenibacillus sp. GSMTC-2017]MBH5319661.1 N-acetyltransferase [Paenibacillus sp. GSMTC-2017]
MNKDALLEIFNKEQRIGIHYPGAKREVVGHIVRQVIDTTTGSYITYSNLSEDNADDIIEEQMAYFKAHGQQFEWKLYDYDQPANLRDRLQAKGFEIGEAEALMILEVGAEHPLLALEIPDYIRPITDDAGIDLVMKLEETIWNEPHAELGTQLKQDIKNDPDSMKIYAAYDDNGQVVSAAWMHLQEGTSFGSLWGGSTLPEYRGKGIYQALIAVRAQEAWKRGFTLLTVDASPMSRPILERRGFLCLAMTYPCVSPSE